VRYRLERQTGVLNQQFPETPFGIRSAAMCTAGTILETGRVGKHHLGARALDASDFDLRSGEVLA
jgi:hypothetical protein